MPNILRGKLYLGIFILIWFSTSVFELQAQVCSGFPAILELGSQKTPDKLCSPVTATLNYNIRFASPVPPGTLQIEYNWNDGDVETFNLATGITTYTHSRAHPFPEDSDCEFNVVITLIYNGVRCASTRQVQKVASWRTDEFNGGNVQLISPVTGTNVHEVCEGIDIDVIFPDETNFNCNPNYVHAPGPLPVESPNVERRWQQIVYNTNDPAVISKIPNITVDGVAITNATGGDLPGRADYMDPRGVFYMASPVLPTTAKRPTLRIEAPGGFGPGYPQVGDEFQITLRYWNFCNPYSNDLMNPNVPVSGDFINGDNDPVERTAYIRIVNSPNAPDPSTDTRCYGQSPDHFTVSNVPAGYRVNWYRNDGGIPGTQITGSNTSSSSLDRNKAGTGYTNNTTPGTYIVWASVQPNVVGGMNCESDKVMVTRTVRSQVTVPDPSIDPPTEICRGDAFSITMPLPGSLAFGGNTEYTWAGSSGVIISGTPTATSATFSTIGVAFSPGQTYVDRTITVRRRFTTTPNCETSRNFNIRIYRPSVGGTPSSVSDVCETSPVGTIALSGHIGDIVRWEVKKDAAPFVTYTGFSSGNSIEPGVLPSGVYLFRAVVKNGPCGIAYSGEEQVTISANPGLAANAGANQYLCGPLISAPMGASNPAPGIGTWSYIASLSTPTSLPTPTISDINDPNATIQITAANAGTYVMRWTVANGTCTSSDDVIIDFGADPTDPLAGDDKPVCGTMTTLEGNTLSIGLGEWIVMSGPGGCTAGAGNCPQLNIINPTSPVSDIELTGTPQYGTYTLRWTATSGGAACFYEEDEVLITFDEPVLITSAPDVDGGCIDPNNLVPIALSGTMGGGGVSGHWEVVSGDGTVTGTPDLSNPLTDGYTPTINDYNAGTPIVVKFVVSPAGTSSCPAVEEEVEITIDRKPVADAGSDIGNICSDQIQLNAEIPIPFGATGVWSSPDPGLTFHSSADGTTLDNTDPQAFVKGLSLGANSVTWTLTSASGVCMSDPSTITLTRVVLPASTAYDVYECELSPAGGLVETSITLTNYEDDVTSVAAANRQITWYRHGPPPGGTLVPTPSSPEFNVVDNQLYVARIRELTTNCTSDANVTIHVRPLPTAINGSAALCEDTPGGGEVTGIDLTDNFYISKVTGGAIGVDVKWYNTLLDAQTNLFEISAPFDMVGNRKVYAAVTYSSPNATQPACPNFAELDLLINEIPTPTGISGDPTVCMGRPMEATETQNEYVASLPIYTYQITSFPGAKYHWTVPQGAGEFILFAGGGINDFFVILKYPYNAAPVDLDISVVIELNSCSSTLVPLTIQRTATPLPPTVSGLNEVCENRQGAVYNITGSNPSSDYVWTIARQSDDLEGGAFIVTGQGSDEIIVNFTDEPINITVREQNENCSGPARTVPVGVNLLPRMQDNDPLVCSDAPTGIQFQAQNLNPVINYYNILSFSGAAPYVTCVGPCPVAANNVADTHIQNHAFENLTAVPRTVNYEVEPVSVSGTGLVCAGPSQYITVTIQPEPQLNSGLNKNICSEESTSIRLISEANTFPADKFIVTAIGSMGDPAVLPAGVAPVDPNHMLIADGVTLHDDNIIMDHAFTNTSGSNAVVSYTIVPYSTLIGCPGNPPSPVLLTIHPQTTVDNPPLTASPYCNGDLVNVEFNSTDNPDANFLWTVKSYDPQIILGSPAAGAGDVSNMIVSNSDLTTSGFIRFGVKGKNIASEETTAGCPNPELLFDVEIKPSPEANNLLGLDACSDLPGGSTYTTDLESLEASVTPDNLDPTTQIDWYQNYPATPITTPTVNAYPMQGGVPVFVEVSSTITGCSKVVQVSYDVHPNVSLQVQNEVDITCFGDNNGEVRVGVLTGTPPQYSFQIKRDTDVSFGPKINVTAALYNFTALQGGDYNVRVEDSEGCFAVINANVIEPPVLQVSIPIPPLKEISCFGGSDGEIQAIATGGVTPYSYVLTQTGASEPTGIFTNLSTGSYVVQVTDNNGCDANTTAFLAQPTQVVINSMVAEINAYGGNLSCNNAVDGRIDFDATGGNAGNYSYELFRNNGALPYKAITNTPNTTDFFDQLEHGNYLLIAYDAKSCPSSPKFAAINNPQPFDPGVIGSNMSVCSGFAPDEIRQLAPAFGGLGNYQYSWEQSADGANWFNVLGENQPTYVPPVLNHDPTIPVIYYRRIVTTGGCAPGINNPVEVTINPTPVASLMAPSELCKYDASGIVQLSLSPGAYPVRFDYKVSENGLDKVNFINIIRGDPATITVGEILEDMTFTFSNIVDFNGCSAADPAPIDINVFEVDADFSLSDTDICSGEQITADWTVATDISYVLNFGDGEIRPFGANTATGSEAKSYLNNSTQNPNNYVVTLQATALFLNNCTTSTSQVLTVGPTTLINLLPGPQDLCSGEFFTVQDKSEGVTASRWYRQMDPADPGTRQEVAQGPLDPFTIQVNNTTTTNPQEIKFIYEAENGSCPGATREFDVRVYPYSVANFTVDNDEPIYTGGIAVVNFTNESDPLETDNTVIDYIWDFDEDDAIITPQGLNHEVRYITAANKTVKLTAVNQLRAACSSTFSMEINVQLPELMANFNVTPRASCLPLTIETVNGSAGSDSWEWDLIGPDFTLTSTAREPMWNIATPGTYTVRHRAFMTGNPTVSEATPITIQVFDNPIANFELFQARIYKGTEFPVINRSINASEFSWNFGDHPESQNSTSPSPTYRYESEGEYLITLTAFNDHGPFDQDGDGVEDGNVICSDVLTKNIFVQPGGSLKIPNAFTPNVSNPDGSNPGDGTNDIFLPVMDGVEEFTMHIFDRWGTLIFESQDKTKGWNGYDRNGRLMPAGVYVYKVVLRLGDDTRTTKIGDVTLIR